MKLSIRTRLLATSLIAGAAMLGTPALAQSDTTPSTESEAPPPESDTIIVTGSRISRPELALPNPVQVFNAQTIEQSGKTNLTDFLLDQPALIGSQGNINAAGSNVGNSRNVGVNLLDLRNLGASRTLVLVDGRRHVAGYPGSASVDINTIPTDLVEQVDVLTGGASAIYGADGVSGVVNFILKKDFEGLRLRGQTGISQRGDSGSRFFAGTFGKNFSEGRGNITLAYEFNETDRFSQRKRLNYGRTGPSYSLVRNPADFPDDPNVPDYVLMNGLRWADSSPGGAVDLDGDFVPDFTGEGTPYDPGTYLRGTAFTIGGSSTERDSYFGDYTPYTRRHIVNAMTRFEFSPALELYAEAKYVKSFAQTVAQPSFDFFTTLFEDNAYLIDRYGAAAITGDAAFSRDNFDFGIRSSELDRELFRSVVGVKGQITPHLRYDVSYVFGQVDQTSVDRNSRISDRYYAALDAVRDPVTNAITCRINLPGETDIRFSTANGTPYAGGIFTFRPGECVPLNILGNGTPSQEALNWVRADHASTSRIRQYVGSGYLSGDTGGFFSLPGGPVGFAVGAEYRKEESLFTPSDLSQRGVLDDSAQLRIDRGDFDVKEVYGEINLPLLSDMRFAQELSIGGAIRYSDYSTIGSTTTWNVNGTYSPVRDITLRGTYSEAVRAPNITELFAGGSGTYEFITDPCGIDRLGEGTSYRAANCASVLTALGIDPATFNPADDPNSPQFASKLGFQGGNRELTQETAKTWTAGLVLRPSFVPGLSITADWYDIRLQQAIQYADAVDVVELCVDQPTLDNVYCDVIARDPTTGYISDFTIIPQNVAAFETAGLDVTLSYAFEPFANAGRFNLRLAGNYLDKLRFVPSAGADPEDKKDYASYPAPEFSGNFDLTWTKGPLQLNYGINWQSKTRRVTREQEKANPDYTAPDLIWYKERWEHELYASYNVDDRFQFYGGVNNLFDQKPDDGAVAYPVSAVGRSFFVGFKATMF